MWRKNSKVSARMRQLSMMWRSSLIRNVCAIALLLISAANAAEWQNKYTYEEIRANFKQPPLWYAPHTFWFWDAPLDTSVTAAMAHEMTKQRLNPGYAHARHSGAPDKPYPSLPVDQWLSPLWFKSFSAALTEAEKAGMTLGYCDEFWWPSGQAAGRVLKKNPDLAAQSLRWERKEIHGPASLDLPEAKFTVAGKYSEKGKLQTETLKLIGDGNAFQWQVPAGQWVIYSYSTYHHSGVDGGEVNYLDDRLMDVFIPIAHESYAARFGKQMGLSIPGVFVDNEGDFGWQMAWSDYLAERYMELKKRDIRPWLPLLTEEDDDGLWVKARYDWFDVVSDVYSSQYLGRLSNWLHARDMYCISNLWEEDLMLQTRAVGDFMRAQRAVSMPGNDCLQMKSQQVHDFKETQSVCEFEDKPFMSELMGVAGWEQTPVEMKMTLNAVTAWGITHTVPHGINLNRNLETIPYPADWYTENPYWRYLHLWTDFARRAAFVNRQGKLTADILLLNPLESVWALSAGYFKGEDRNPWPDQIAEINEIYSNTMKILSENRLDYLIADRYYMEKAAINVSEHQKIPVLQIAGHDFSALVLPPMVILSCGSAEKILNFARAGGSVFLLGDLPAGSPEKGARDDQMIRQMQELSGLPTVINLSDTRDRGALLAAKLTSVIEPQLEISGGDLPLLLSHRRLNQKEFYWLVNNTNMAETLNLSFRDGKGRAEIWDCENGTIRTIPSREQGKRTVITHDFKPYEAFWLVFDSSQPAVIDKQPEKEKYNEQVLAGPWTFSFPEANTVKTTSARCLISTDTNDVAPYLQADFDDTDWPWLNITGPLRLTDQWRASLLYNPEPESDRYYRYRFELQKKPDGALVNINADNEYWLWVNNQSIPQGPNASDLAEADMYDIGPLLKKGENIIAVKTSNHPGYGSLIFQGTVQLADGSLFDINSGENCKESKQLHPGWQKLTFNDADWETAFLADPQVQEQNLRSIRKPRKVVFTKSVAWWRLDIPPAASEVQLPGLSQGTKIWLDGKPAKVHDSRIMIKNRAGLMVIKIDGSGSGLSGPIAYTCPGKGQVDEGSWLELGLRNFTGFADYEATVTISDLPGTALLDLGKVLHMAEVWINNEKAGERLWPPFEFEIRKLLKKGENRVRVRIGNLMVNEMGISDDLGTLRHWGWNGVPQDAEFDAGLFGPVRIIFYK